MATDSVARILAMAALEGSGGGGGKQVESAYVDEDGHLHLVYQDGTDMDVGRVMGKVFAPSIIRDSDGRVILHWDLKEDATEVPEDIFLRMERAEWTDVDPEERGDKYSELEWSGLDVVDDPHPEHGFSGDVPNILQNDSGAEDFMWDTI